MEDQKMEEMWYQIYKNKINNEEYNKQCLFSQQQTASDERFELMKSCLNSNIQNTNGQINISPIPLLPLCDAQDEESKKWFILFGMYCLTSMFTNNIT